MFSHIFVYRFKCLIRDRQMVFWTLLFPIVLATFFNLAFSNLGKSDTFTDIPVAVVDNAAYRGDTAFQAALKSVSGAKGASAGTRLFKVTVASEGQASYLLKNSKIDGYLDLDGSRVVVKSSGINQTIIQEFMDDYLQMKAAAKTIVSNNPAEAQSIAAAASSPSSSSGGWLKEITPTRAAPNMILTYFYALIAMASLYGGFWGLKEIVAVQADLSPQGMRVNVAPVNKLKIFGYSLCAAMAMQMIMILVLLGYLMLVLKVSFGGELPYVLLACLAGSCCGVSFGAMIGAVVKKGEGLKIAILISASMVMSFLSGLMSAYIKYAVTKAFPPLAYLNPANLIADAFYSLYYYNTHARYFLNIGLLFAFTAVFYLIVYFVMRRQKYAAL